MTQLLARYAEYVDDAIFQGKLYKIQDYPGAIASQNPSDSVFGEVFLLNNIDLVLPQLDEYEECSPQFHQPTEYIRGLKMVKLSSGKMVEAWVYLYNRPAGFLEPLPSGDYLYD
jgi:gamma-glutamylcyclotransferase (GGCT)/AIG2-like uncharacterized protein YtfP